MSNYQLTVGLEIHVELETKTKMFCGCKNDPFFSEPNTNVCPVCYGLPGALPLLNQEAIAMVARFGHAIGAEVAQKSFWARKNYFYPDLPKGYQISQSTDPLVVGGKITIDGTDYQLNHAHLEEDAGKLLHAPDKSHSLADYNRAGVPLLEIVTEPDFHDAASAKLFCQELQRLMRSLKISSADMEKGRMRCEANISVSKTDQFGTKVEVKNINSFRSVERAIEYEFIRQTEALEKGEQLVQETRTWNDEAGKTITMRTKETSADYRYFPEPDLPWVSLVDFQHDDAHLMPDEQRQALANLELPQETIQAIIDKDGFALVMNIAKEDAALAREAGKLLLAVPQFAELSEPNQITVLKAKEAQGWARDTVAQIVDRALKEKKTIEELIPDFVHGEDLSAVLETVLAANKDAVESYKAGKEAAFNFLVGQVMAQTQGRANIQTVRDELKKVL